jgi:hypothetical protein
LEEHAVSFFGVEIETVFTSAASGYLAPVITILTIMITNFVNFLVHQIGLYLQYLNKE